MLQRQHSATDSTNVHLFRFEIRDPGLLPSEIQVIGRVITLIYSDATYQNPRLTLRCHVIFGNDQNGNPYRIIHNGEQGHDGLHEKKESRFHHHYEHDHEVDSSDIRYLLNRFTVNQSPDVDVIIQHFEDFKNAYKCLRGVPKVVNIDQVPWNAVYHSDNNKITLYRKMHALPGERSASPECLKSYYQHKYATLQGRIGVFAAARSEYVLTLNKLSEAEYDEIKRNQCSF